MKPALFLCILLCLYVTSSYCDYIIADTKEDFNKERDENKYVLALFTKLNAQGCSDCSIAKETINSLVDELEDNTDISIVIVDCEARSTKKFCKEFEFETLPTILLFHGQLAVYEYTKAYVYLEALQDFINKYTGDKYVTISTADELTQQIEQHKVSVVGFFDKNTDNAVRKSFERTAAHLFLSFNFVILELEDNEATLALLSEQDAVLGSVKLYKNLGGSIKSLTYQDDNVSRKRLTNWIERHEPWFAHDLDASKNVFVDIREKYPHLPILTVYVDPKDTVNTKESILVELEKTAEEFQRKILFTYLFITPESQSQLEILGYVNNEFPVMTLSKPATRELFTHPTNEVNHESMKKFCRGVLEGQILAHKIKQVAPEENDGVVKVVVHDTYRSIVHDPLNDVVVFFYVPRAQCEHCFVFMEKFESVAQKLSHVPNLVFAKLNVAANSRIPSVRVGNFPTVQLYKMANKFNEEIFSGPRTEEDLEKWVLANLTNEHKTHDQLGSINDIV